MSGDDKRICSFIRFSAANSAINNDAAVCHARGVQLSEMTNEKNYDNTVNIGELMVS